MSLVDQWVPIYNPPLKTTGTSPEGIVSSSSIVILQGLPKISHLALPPSLLYNICIKVRVKQKQTRYVYLTHLCYY